MALYTIPSGLSFLDVFAEGVIEKYGDDPLRLGKVHIFLPSKRACRLLTELLYAKYQNIYHKSAFFLPHLIPMGEISLDDIEINDQPELENFNIPPAISALKRQFILGHLVFAWGKTQNIGLHRFDQAFQLAQKLAGFLDQLQSEAIPLHRLKNLVPDLYAKHWQITLNFLSLLSENWPKILEENQKLDPIERRNLLFESLIALYKSSPPSDPVLIAGSTGTFPMTTRLMQEVLKIKDGHVILPGIDLNLDEQKWQELRHQPIHPQHQLARLCQHNQWHRKDIQTWHGCARETPQSLFLSTLFGSKTEISKDFSFLNDVNYLKCQDHDEEANVIALILKESLLDPLKKTVLITADRDLVKRVKANLSRWSIEIDDSHGTELIETKGASFLLLLFELLNNDFEPIMLLSILKHPFLQPETESFLEDLEVTCLRGAHKPKISSLIQKMSLKNPIGEQFLITFLEATKELKNCLRQEQIDINELIVLHLKTAESIVKSLLWKGEDGLALSRFFKNLLHETRNLPRIDPVAYGLLLRQFLAKEVFRPLISSNSNIAIWGTIEARLQNVDRVILAGLNEGSWPPEIKSDPWLNKNMRETLGLPPIERRIGLSAHDFCQAFGTKEIYLTRSERINGIPQCPSHWLLKLENLLESLGLESTLSSKKPYLDWAKILDQPTDKVTISQPKPKPSIHLRPRILSATQIETLLRNPYAIYARHILGLKPLDPIQQEPHQAHFGNLIHKILETFQKNHPGYLMPDDRHKMNLIAQEQIKQHSLSPDLLFFWEPTIASILAWFFEQEQKRRPFIKNSLLEQKGQALFNLEGGSFIIKAIADRIDFYTNGNCEIIDYKTGQLPLQKDMLLGFSAQLFIEAFIALKGGFGQEINPEQLKLSLWRLKGKEDKAEIKDIKEDLSLVLPEIAQNLIALLNHYDNPETPYVVHPYPDKAPPYDPYRHLSRIDEWGEK
jgi:ATP-dependent helicase/nuclease subunit B